MGEATEVLLCHHFQGLPDPRAHNVVHKLHDMIVLAVCAVICGADGWIAVELFAKRKLAWLKTFLDLPGRRPLPRHVRPALRPPGAPGAFERCFTAWVAALAGGSGGKLIAVDGKAIRRSFEHGWDKSGMAHLVSAFVADNRLVFAQVAVEGKGNEITALPGLLELLDLRGATVTIDAMGCQRAAAGQIVAGGGHYALALKDNQPTLHGKVRAMLDEVILQSFAGMSHGFAESADDAHGRVERRRVWVTDEVHWVQDRLQEPWPHLASVAVVECVRQDLGDLGGKVSAERRYFLKARPQYSPCSTRGRCSSRPGTDAAAMAAAVRGHWSVENSLHRQLDVSFREDGRRIRVGHGAENFSRLCRLALNLLKRDKRARAGIHGKRLKAGSDGHYLIRLLTQ